MRANVAFLSSSGLLFTPKPGVMESISENVIMKYWWISLWNRNKASSNTWISNQASNFHNVTFEDYWQSHGAKYSRMKVKFVEDRLSSFDGGALEIYQGSQVPDPLDTV